MCVCVCVSESVCVCVCVCVCVSCDGDILGVSLLTAEFLEQYPQDTEDKQSEKWINVINNQSNNSTTHL